MHRSSYDTRTYNIRLWPLTAKVGLYSQTWVLDPGASTSALTQKPQEVMAVLENNRTCMTVIGLKYKLSVQQPLNCRVMKTVDQ